MGSMRIRGSTVLALGAAVLLSLAGRVEARYPYPEDPPTVTTPPPPPPGTTTGDCEGEECCEDCGGSTPPGGTQHMPEPATLVSALLGAGLMGAYATRRRRKQAAE